MDTTKSRWWVGQRVHACAYGDHKVTVILGSGEYPVGVDIGDRTIYFSEDGLEYLSHRRPTLFPIDTEPPRVKVKKRVEGWINLYPDVQGTSHIRAGFEIYTTEQEADDCAHVEKRFGPAHHIIHEWEE